MNYHQLVEQQNIRAKGQMKDIQQQASQFKIQVRQEIIATINAVCTGDPDNCSLGYCQFNHVCGKPFFEEGAQSGHKHKLKSLRRQVKDAAYKKAGKKSPKYIQGQNPHDRISELLGENIYDHELIKDNPEATQLVQQATSLRQINRILERYYFLKYKKYLSLPKGRAHYAQYKNENYV